MVVPVNVNDQHWAAMVIDMRAQTITYMDSLAEDDASDVPETARTTMSHLLRYLEDEHRTQYDGKALPEAWRRPDALRGGTTATCPQQSNGCDCGVFTAMMMHSMAVHGHVRGYLTEDAAQMRERMFTDLESLAKGDALDSSSAVDVGGNGQQIRSPDDGGDSSSSDTDDDDDNDDGMHAGVSGAGTGGRMRGTGRRASAGFHEWEEDGAHSEDEDDTGAYPRLHRDTKMVADLHDQDWIHVVKKLVNNLHVPTRALAFTSKYLATLNHVDLVRRESVAGVLKLQLRDTQRKDRQNWSSTQRVISRHVRVEMKRLEAPEVDGERMMGTRAYLEMCWKYTQIFYSKTLSMAKRVEYAAYVIHFLRLWRMYVYRTVGLSLGANFITRETFQDTILSCHCLINSIRKMRDFSKGTALALEKFGSDCCEKHFSAQGSWQENKRNYTASTMQNCMQKENWLGYLKVDPDGPRWAKPKHHKRVWSNEDLEPGPEIDYIVRDDCNDEVIAGAWKTAFAGAKACLEAMEMAPPQGKAAKGNLWAWWESAKGLHEANETYEGKMQHNMRSDAADELSFDICDTEADPVDPDALVGRVVNLPATCFFGDDAIPAGCNTVGHCYLKRYVRGRRNKPAFYEMEVTHDHWPVEACGVPTIFECRAEDVHERLDDAGFLQVERVNEVGHEEEQAMMAMPKDTRQKGDTTDLDTWFSRAGGEETAEEEAADLAALEAEAAAEPRKAISAFVTTPAGKVRSSYERMRVD
jgi:hypothetical protein